MDILVVERLQAYIVTRELEMAPKTPFKKIPQKLDAAITTNGGMTV